MEVKGNPNLLSGGNPYLFFNMLDFGMEPSELFIAFLRRADLFFPSFFQAAPHGSIGSTCPGNNLPLMAVMIGTRR
jgi:hypothetical protein